MKEEEAWQGRGFERHLKPKMPSTKMRGESMNMCGGKGGTGGPGRVMNFRQSRKLLGRQGELVKGSEHIITWCLRKIDQVTRQGWRGSPSTMQEIS